LRLKIICLSNVYLFVQILNTKLIINFNKIYITFFQVTIFKLNTARQSQNYNHLPSISIFINNIYIYISNIKFIIIALEAKNNVPFIQNMIHVK